MRCSCLVEVTEHDGQEQVEHDNSNNDVKSNIVQGCSHSTGKHVLVPDESPLSSHEHLENSEEGLE